MMLIIRNISTLAILFVCIIYVLLYIPYMSYLYPIYVLLRVYEIEEHDVDYPKYQHLGHPVCVFEEAPYMSYYVCMKRYNATYVLIRVHK